MPIRFRCTNCNQQLSITSRKAGHLIRCPACKVENIVPQKHESLSATAGTEPEGSSQNAVAGRAAQTDFDEDEGLALRSPETDFEQMDLTPMVDVTFLLLIFFMITASFTLQKTIQVPPPDPDQEGATLTIQEIKEIFDKSIKISIDERNNITIDDEPLSDPANLVEAIRTRMREERKTELVLKVNYRTVHETVVTVVDAAHEVGMEKIRLTAIRTDD
jgi:biopolymer transport protein ExbD